MVDVVQEDKATAEDKVAACDVAKKYWKMLKECGGMIAVGAILFAVLNGISNGCGTNSAVIQGELKAHETVFLSLSSQAAGLAIIFCGIFYMNAGSKNATFLAELVATPFVTFLRDGASIAVGASLFRCLQVLEQKKYSEIPWLPLLEWLAFMTFGTAIILSLEYAEQRKEVDLNRGAIIGGAICVVVGVVFIFKA